MMWDGAESLHTATVLSWRLSTPVQLTLARGMGQGVSTATAGKTYQFPKNSKCI